MSYLFDSTLGVATLGTRALSQRSLVRSFVDIEIEYSIVSHNEIVFEFESNYIIFNAESSFVSEDITRLIDIDIQYNTVSTNSIDTLHAVYYLAATSSAYSEFVTACNVYIDLDTDTLSAASSFDTNYNMFYQIHSALNGVSVFKSYDAYDIEIAMHYIAGFVDEREFTPTTLGRVAAGTPHLGIHPMYKRTNDVPVTMLYDVKLQMEARSHVYADIALLHLVWCAMHPQLHSEANITYTVRGLDGIKISPWIYYATDGKYGRIHIPTDPYM